MVGGKAVTRKGAKLSETEKSSGGGILTESTTAQKNRGHGLRYVREEKKEKQGVGKRKKRGGGEGALGGGGAGE